jgi:hypothetical protein
MINNFVSGLIMHVNCFNAKISFLINSVNVITNGPVIQIQSQSFLSHRLPREKFGLTFWLHRWGKQDPEMLNKSSNTPTLNGWECSPVCLSLYPLASLGGIWKIKAKCVSVLQKQMAELNLVPSFCQILILAVDGYVQ